MNFEGAWKQILRVLFRAGNWALYGLVVWVIYKTGLLKSDTVVPEQVIRFLEALTSAWHLLFEITGPITTALIFAIIGNLLAKRFNVGWARRMRILALEEATSIFYTFATFTVVGSFTIWCIQHDPKMRDTFWQTGLATLLIAVAVGGFWTSEEHENTAVTSGNV